MTVDLVENLNPEQREAVLHFSSPLLIVAAAGTGKTRVITHKIAYLVRHRDLAPFRILGVTFTNKAASEMKTRIEALTGIDARQFNISTFHSLGLRILRESGGRLGFDGDWQVFDSDEQERLIEKIIKEDFSHFTSDMRSAAVRRINQAKMSGAYPNHPDFLRQIGFSEEEVRIYSRYHQFQQTNKKWDYEDLISLPVKLLQSDEEARAKYHDRFRYVVIDEFQDTNPNQYELVRLIAAGSSDITVVGDDDQAIYSWRGANVRFMFEFEDDFPGTKVIKLERNYRSTPQILDLANQVIAGNQIRRKKQMWSENEAGNPAFVLKTTSKEDEAESIARLIQQLQQKRPDLFPLAILYRINSQSLPLETELLKANIPFRILKGLRFFDRKEIKDSLALLKLTMNPADDLAFLRVIDSLPLGIGAKSIETLSAHARAQGGGLFQALQQSMPEKFRGRRILGQIAALHEEKEKHKVSELLGRLLTESGYTDLLREKKEDERLLNIEELLSFIRRWETDAPNESFSQLVDRMTLDAVENSGESQIKVFLLTMHNAKGLEFPTAVVAGINATYMPFFLRKDRAEIEEERRLFYVANTRAIRLLVISTGSDRLSPFLKEIRPSLYTPVFSPLEIISDLMPDTDAAGKEEAEAADARYIEHPVFGKGKIVETLSDTKLLVNFPERGNKLLDIGRVAVKFL